MSTEQLGVADVAAKEIPPATTDNQKWIARRKNANRIERTACGSIGAFDVREPPSAVGDGDADKHFGWRRRWREVEEEAAAIVSVHHWERENRPPDIERVVGKRAHHSIARASRCDERRAETQRPQLSTRYSQAGHASAGPVRSHSRRQVGLVGGDNCRLIQIVVPKECVVEAIGNWRHGAFI